MRVHILLGLAVALLTSSSSLCHAQYFSVRDTNTNGCPVAVRKSPAECRGQVSECWSPGVRDLDCPNNGYCCDNGCADVCLGDGLHENRLPPPQTPVPVVPVAVPTYPKVVKKKPHAAPLKKKEHHHYPKRTAAPVAKPQHHFPVHPVIGRVSTKCPVIPPKSTYECAGRSTHTCWSPGQRDTDCLNHGLCCFDGCANTCLAEVPKIPLPLPPPPPVDPCYPNPCGKGAFCTNQNGNALCQCEPGLVPMPDTIQGCGHECTADSDCSYGEICSHYRCIEKPDPCNPSPCGPNTFCEVSHTGNPVCNCISGYVPSPDTITGCDYECYTDYDCHGHNLICSHHRCVERPDPCQPSPCGPNTHCAVNSQGNPVCKCNEGFIPDGDSIKGCRYECIVDSDCSYGLECSHHRCMEPEDPCKNMPCGPGAFCTMGPYNNAICQCEPGLVPKPDTITGCGPECTSDYDCVTGYICHDTRCIERPDPCDPSPCGPGTICTPNNRGNPVCTCEPGLVPNGNTIQGCKPECITDPDCQRGYICENQKCVEEPDPCNPSPCGPGTTCEVNSFRNPICRCLPGRIPMPDTITGCRFECETDYDCGPGRRCSNHRCEDIPDPCNPNPCGMMAECRPIGHSDYDCVCPRGTFGDGFAGCIQGECQHDADCSTDKACINYYCVNPCLTNNTCRAQDFCKVRNHVPVCGYDQDPPPQAKTPVVIGGKYEREPPSSGRTRPTTIIGASYEDNSPRGPGSRPVRPVRPVRPLRPAVPDDDVVIISSRNRPGSPRRIPQTRGHTTVIGFSNNRRKKRHALSAIQRSLRSIESNNSY